MTRTSAGLLMYRIRIGSIEVLLAHPAGPFFQNKDEGAWSIPKGEIEPDEDCLTAAQRGFEEETGIKPTGPFTALTPVKQKGGKVVHAYQWLEKQTISANKERKQAAPKPPFGPCYMTATDP